MSLPNRRHPKVMPIQRGFSRKQMEAFTLVELLVGASLSVLVVSSLAAIALIAELRMGKESEVNQSLRDHWGRTMAFINNEAQHANWIRTSITTYPCGGDPPSGPLLVLEGPPVSTNNNLPAWTVVYGVRANGNSREWRGFNRLVRCGPPFAETAPKNTDSDADMARRKAEALAGNLIIQSPYTESVIADQLAATNPFVTELFDATQPRDRDAKVSLFMSRLTGPTYPPAGTFTTSFQTQVRANRNPGFDVTGNPACATTTNSFGNENSPCVIPIRDSLRRVTYVKEYNLTKSGSMTINGCNPTANCVGALSSNFIDVIFLKGNYADFTTKQFAAPGLPNASNACSRTSCYLSNGSQSVQIYDGNVLVFYDQTVRL